MWDRGPGMIIACSTCNMIFHRVKDLKAHKGDMKRYHARRMKHQYYNDCCITNCDNDSMVLIQLSIHSFAWICGMHYMRNIIQKKFGRSSKPDGHEFRY